MGITLACVLLISMCILAWIYTTSIFYQNYKGLSPLANAVAVLPAPIVGLFAAVSPIPRHELTKSGSRSLSRASREHATHPMRRLGNDSVRLLHKQS